MTDRMTYGNLRLGKPRVPIHLDDVLRTSVVVSSQNQDDEIRKAVAHIQMALEILTRLTSGYGDTRTLIEAQMSKSGSNLSNAELEVLTRFADGVPPAQIAEIRRVKQRTVNNQLASATRKLGFSDRREFMGWIGAFKQLSGEE